MQRIVLVGRRGYILGLAQFIASVQDTKEFADIVCGDNNPTPCQLEQLKKMAQASKPEILAQPKCLFSSSAYNRINEHPNDDWRGRGNCRKRIKRNDR
mgnify:CR=1 FL=1